MSKLLFEGYEWDTDLIEKAWKVIDKIGKEDLGLEYAPPQFEVVTAEQMIDAYVSVGMPIYYNHWSFGKQFSHYKHSYYSGKMNLAYELVINSDPCIAYLMQDNTAMMTVLVMAHANVGHASFFKNNYLFKQHTNPHLIVDLLQYAKEYIAQCEDLYGAYEVEHLLDKLHLLQDFAVDRYPHYLSKNKKTKKERNITKIEEEIKSYNRDWDTLPKYATNSPLSTHLKRALELRDKILDDTNISVEYKEENLLRVIEAESLTLKSWQLEIVRIIRQIAQYFYPQMQTKVMNEGWACFSHYYIMDQLYEQGYINEGTWLEFIESHTAVCYQPDMTQINPYSLGFEMFMDLKRACLNPDEEDYKYLPDIAGKDDWRKELLNIVKNFKDESFILQYLSPKVIRKLKLFSYKDKAGDSFYTVTSTQDNDQVFELRKALSQQFELDNYRPTFECTSVNHVLNEMFLTYTEYRGRLINTEKFDLVRAVLKELTGLNIVIQI